MSDTKHTPGKWMQYKGDNRIVVAEDDSRLVAVTVDDEWDRASGEPDADARLIAAAPELLEALERVEQRARESGECPLCHQPPEVGCAHDCALTAARAAIEKARGGRCLVAVPRPPV